MPDPHPAMALTPAHVAFVHRDIPDTGPPPGMVLQTDADYADWVQRILSSHPAPDRPTTLFAYGSLIWKPELPHLAEKTARATGWHRAFCLRMIRFRGTPERPGLMMALDRGGTCEGMLFTLPPEDLPGQLDRLFRREFTIKPINTMPQWIEVETASGPEMALAFVVNPDSPSYTGVLPRGAVADTLATACGHWGSGAEYLLHTVTHLQAKGIDDSDLWQLQKMVAARIEAKGCNQPRPR